MFIAAILFFSGCEAYKLAKRVYFRRRAKKTGVSAGGDLEERMFARYLTTNSKSDSESERNEKMQEEV